MTDPTTPPGNRQQQMSQTFGERVQEQIDKNLDKLADEAERGYDPSTIRQTKPSPILRWFDYDHLRPPLAAVSSWFHALAHDIERDLPPGPEKSTALRKLLEAKDAAVRAVVEDDGRGGF